jgi:two-component system sensor histidine kinase CpxA
MRSLFLKIFLSFWVSMALIIALVLMTSEPPRRRQAHDVWHSMVGGAMAVNAEAVGHSYEEHGCNGLRAYMEQIQQSSTLRDFVFDQSGTQLCAVDAPVGAVELARTTEPGKVKFKFSRDEHFAALRQQVASGKLYVLVAEMPPAPPFGPPPLARTIQHLLIAIIISGLICFLLARYLASPIGRVRMAAQQIARGNLEARTGGAAARADEVGQLARDFDHMAAQLESLFHAQSRLITDISHELRSPLARLSVALGLARQQAAPAAAAQLDRIERETERLNEMVERLLTLSRLESARVTPKKSLINLPELLREAVADADFEARSRNCRVEVKSVADCSVMGNADLLRSAIENVLRNAIHYTRENTSVEVTLACAGSGNDQKATITVRDRGPGVPETELENLFRPFYRLDRSRERQTGGVGLGLAIAQRAVLLHQGSIRASNAEGGGLKVEITLPASASSAD